MTRLDSTVLAAPRKRELLKRAERLASELAGGQVTRAELRPVNDLLFLSPLSWPERVQQAKQFLEILPGTWLARRSNKTAQQLRHVQTHVGALLSESLEPQELRFLLGWTSRLLHMRDLANRPRR